jgi:predicted dehydrogenase
MDYLQRPPTRTCEVVGDAGRLVLDLRAPSLVWYGADGTEREALRPGRLRTQPALPRRDVQLPRAASPAARGRRCRSATGVDGLRLALAVKRSMATGHVVEVA